MKEKKSKMSIIIAAGALVLVLIACLALYFSMRPQTVAGEKTVTIQVVHKDGSSKDFVLKTNQEYLEGLLLEGKVVEDNQGPYGLYILTADGETVNEANQEWWCITKGGEPVMEGAGTQPVADGEQYELTFTVGYGG